MHLHPIQGRDHLALVVMRLGRRLQRKANRTARSKANITKYKKLIAEETAWLVSLNARDDALNLMDATKIWNASESHPELRHGQEVELGAGTGSYRSTQTGALVYDVDEETSIAEIALRFPEEFDAIVATKQTIRKVVLKGEYAWLLDMLTTASAPGGESFTIRPAVTEEFFRAAVARLRQAAIDFGLLPEPESEESAQTPAS